MIQKHGIAWTVLLMLMTTSTIIWANQEKENLQVIAALQEENQRLRKKIEQLTFFEPHQEIYIIPTEVKGLADPKYPDTQEIVFQLSFKTPVKLFEHTTKIFGKSTKLIPYLAYTQKTFWQFFDVYNSRPVRETNYNTSVILEIFPQLSFDGKVRFDISPIDHESNGETQDRTRSWNRWYIGALYETMEMKLYLQFLKRYDELPLNDQNPYIESYYGQLGLTLDWKRYGVVFKGRKGNFHDKGYFELGWSPFCRKSTIEFQGLCIHLRYWDGYGHSLEWYDQRIVRWGIGLLLMSE